MPRDDIRLRDLLLCTAVVNPYIRYILGIYSRYDAHSLCQMLQGH